MEDTRFFAEPSSPIDAAKEEVTQALIAYEVSLTWNRYRDVGRRVMPGPLPGDSAAHQQMVDRYWENARKIANQSPIHQLALRLIVINQEDDDREKYNYLALLKNRIDARVEGD